MNRQHLVQEKCMPEVPPLHKANPCFQAQGDLQRELMKQRRTLKALQSLTQDLPESIQLGILLLMQKELIRKIIWLNNRGIRFRKCISKSSQRGLPSQVGGRPSRQECVLVPITHRKRSQNSGWLIRRTIFLTSQSFCGHRFPNFEMLDAKIASSLKKTIQNSNFKKKINPEEQKAQPDYRFLRGRQTAFRIFEYCWVTGTHEAILDYPDLFGITSHGDDVQGFDTRWDKVLSPISQVHQTIFRKVCTGSAHA